jgi:hypothetical protein
VANRRGVHRSTHAAASACLPTPVPASRCLGVAPAEIDRLTRDSRPYGPESAFHGLRSADDEHLLRNEGAVGSNPITSTTERLVAPATRVRHEVARVEWIHRLEVDDVEDVAQVRVRWPVPSLTCVAGNGGVRSSGDQAQGLLFHPAATGEGEDRTGEHP